MQSLEGTHDGRRIVLPVAVLGADTLTDLTHERGTALLDTGATSSAITARFIEKLGLISIGKRRVMVATEQRFIDFYFFRLGLFAQNAKGPDESTWPHVFAETEGFQIQQSDNFDVLLGMDVINQCDLRVDRSGRWRLQFG